MKSARNLAPLALSLLLLLAVGLAIGVHRQREAARPATGPEAVLEFRLLLGTRFDEAAKRPVFSEALRRLDGQPVVIAGYMLPSPASDDAKDFRGFRLVEHPQGLLMRPPAANEAIYVEQAARSGKGADSAAGGFPHQPGSLSVRGILRLAGYGGPNRGLEKGYWFAIEDAEIDPLGAP